jgi:hypothetical protein
MADILIKNMEMPKECYKTGTRHCPCFYSCEVVRNHLCKLTFAESEDIYKGRLTGCPLVELPPHGRLGDIDKMIAECREKPFPVYISSSEELADVLEEYVNLDKIGHTVIVPASEETDKDCQSCFWYQQRGCQFQCVHEHGECNGERFEQAEP